MDSKEEPDLGNEYQFAVTTYLASLLSRNNKVEDYSIYNDVASAGIFGNIVVRVQYRGSDRCTFFHISVYNTNYSQITGKLDLNFAKWRDSFDEIKKSRVSKWKKDISNSDTLFCLFSDKVAGDFVFSYDTIPIELCTRSYSETDDILSSILFFNSNWYKLPPDCLRDEDEEFCKQFHVLLNIPNFEEICKIIIRICKADPQKLTELVTDYFQDSSQHEVGLSKVAFEVFILKDLHSLTFPLTQMVDVVHDQRSDIWNKITLEHDITVVSNAGVNVQRSIYGCWSQKINNLLETIIDWDIYATEENTFSDEILQSIKEYFKGKESGNLNSRTQASRSSYPTSLISLIIELWTRGDLPILLKTDITFNNFEKYRDREKSYIIIDDLGIRSQEQRPSDLKIWINMDDIIDINLRDSILEKTMVSLQGRNIIDLKSLIGDNAELRKSISCTDMLGLMKKRTAYVKEDLLYGDDYLAFIIEDQECDGNENCIKVIDGNIKIICPPNAINEHIITLQTKYPGYGIYHLYRKNSLLQLIEGDKSKLTNCFVDQYEDPVYNMGREDSIPIIGQVIALEKRKHIQRHLRRAIICKSYFSLDETKICLLSGELDTLDKNIEVIESDINAVTKYMTEPKTYFLKMQVNNTVDWKQLSSLDCPVVQVNVRNGKFEYLRSSHCSNLSSHILYEGGRISEEEFTTEIRNKTSGITVISGEPGIGKSNLLRWISNVYDTQNYVLFFDLVDLITYLDEFDETKANIYNTGKGRADFIDFLIEKLQVDMPEKYYSFISALYRNKRVILLLDSFDEIADSWGEQVLSSIKFTKRSDLQIIIATRSNCSSLLMYQHNMQIFKLERLEQSKKQYISELNLTENELQGFPIEFTTNPLYLNFLKKLLSQDGIKNENKYSLYEKLLEMKFKQYVKRTRCCTSRVNDVRSLFQNLALVAVLGKMYVKRQLWWTYNDSIRDKLRFGIVVNFDEEGNPEFYSNTFVSVLCRQWITTMKEDKTLEFAKNIYKRMLAQKKLQALDVFCEDLELHKAVIDGNISKVTYICSQHPQSDYLRKRDELGRTALHVAAICCRYSNGSDNSVKILEQIVKCLSKSSDVTNTVDTIMNWNWTHYMYDGMYSEIDIHAESKLNLLHIASYYGNLNVVKRLLEEPTAFDINVVDNYDCTPLDYAIMQHTATSLQYSAEHDSVIRPQVAASLDLIQLLLTNGASTVRKSDHGEYDTSLCLAVKSNNVAVLQTLLEDQYNVNVNIYDKNKETPIHIATKADNVTTVNLLLGRQAEINNQNSDGRTPLHIAGMNGSLNIVKLLLEHGADVNIKDAAGNTPLDVAEKNQSGNEELKRLLKDIPLKVPGIQRHSLKTPFRSTASTNEGAIKHSTSAMDQLPSPQLREQHYEKGVIALLACSLSKNTNVKDYVIYHNVKCNGKFDGIVVRMEIENPNEQYLCIIQVCEKTETLNLNHMIDIQNDSSSIYRRNKPDNIRFWILCNGNINTPIRLVRDNSTFDLTLVQCSKEDEINNMLFPFNAKRWKYVCEDPASTSYNCFLDECYLHLNQPGYNEIVRCINDIYDITRTNDIISYVQKYFDENVLHQQGLSKHIFEMELQKIHLYDSIIFSNRVFGYLKKPAVVILNRIMLKQDVTVIDDTGDESIEKFVASCLTEAVYHILEVDVDSDPLKVRDDKPLDEDIKEKFYKHSKMKSCRYWISLPNTLSDLLIELWKCGDVPLVLKSNNYNLSFFEDHQHLKRSYILIGELQKELERKARPDIKIFRDVSNITKLQNALLVAIKVSLQSRKPTTLKAIVDDDTNVMKQLTCVDIIQMMTEKLLQEDSVPAYHPMDDIFIPTIGQVILPEEKHYIRRYVRKATIAKACLKPDKGHIFLVSGTDFIVHPDLHLIQIDVDDHISETNCYFQIKQDNRQTYWDKLIAIKRPVFDVIMKNRKLELLRYMHCSSLNSHITFEGERLSEEGLLKAIRENPNTITVITGEKGTGKTNLLKSLCNIDDSHNYNLFYDLKQLETLLRQNEEILSEPLEFIFKECHKKPHKHNSFLLELCKRKRLSILLDSFNEITCDYKKEILTFIKNIPSGVQIIIGSRPEACDDLTKQFCTTIFKMDPLNGDNIQCPSSELITDCPETKHYLHDATKKKDVSSVRKLLYYSFNVNLADEYQRTPLHYAAHGKCTDICSLLLDTNDIEINYQDDDKKIPLNYAVEGGALDIAKLLLENKSEVNHKDRFGKSLLHYAAERNSIDIMRLLIIEGADLNTADKDGKTPLHYSAENGSINIIKLLLENGADDNLTNTVGKTPHDCAEGKTKLLLANLLEDETIETPFQVAKTRNCVDINLEIEKMESVNHQDEDDNTLLHYAVQNEIRYLLQLLLDKGAALDMQNRCRKTPLHFAVEGANLDIVKLLLNGGTDANIRDIYQKTPLHYASEKGNIDCIKLLLQNGADINLQCAFGRSALHYAIKETNEESLTLLLEKGAGVNLQDQDGDTALHYAVKKNIINCVNILLDNGANRNVQNKYKQTSIHFAIKYNSINIFNVLVEKNADINLQDEDNRTLLHYAAEQSNSDFTKQLLMRNVTMDVKDKTGEVPLHYAVECKCANTTKILLKAQADANIQDKQSKTPLHYATKGNNIDMVELYYNVAQT